MKFLKIIYKIWQWLQKSSSDNSWILPNYEKKSYLKNREYDWFAN